MTVDDDVTGKVVILTGASRGIGRGLALHLARRGAQPGRDRPQARAARGALGRARRLGAEHLALVSNVADRAAAPSTSPPPPIERFGRIDGLVANAQTFRSVTPLDEVTESDMDLLFDTGPKGTLWLMQAVFPHMRDQGWGRIVTMGSNGALNGAAGYGPYVGVEGGDPRPHPGRRPRVGHRRHHRELRVPGVGRPPRAARPTTPSGRDRSPPRTPTSRSPATATPRTTSRRSSRSCCPTRAGT